MLEAILVPWQLAAFVAIALALAWAGDCKAGCRARLLFFLAFNLVILGGVLGTWKGLAFYSVYAWVCGYGIRRMGPDRKHSRWWCIALIALLVAGLLIGKYLLPHSVRGALAIRHVWNTISLSFLTFRLLHVVLDAHAGLFERVEWVAFLNYVFFAPVSVCGPIQKYGEFAADLRAPRSISAEVFVGAIQRMVLGIAKKVLLAGLLTPYILGNMEPSGSHPMLMLLLACLFYSVFIYADFSGYTDIAIGSAMLLGIRLPENFNKPWLAENLQDFWNRWHITLTAWLRTYLFYPLNKGMVRRFPQHARRLDPMTAVIITFAVAGLWHGNTWNFLVFGLMHGAGIAFHFLLRGRRGPEHSSSWGWTLGARFCTLIYVSLSWIPFVYPLEEIPWLLRQSFGAP